MRAIITFALLGVISIVPGMGQQASSAMSDSQTLQAILVEMRSMHNDVRLGQTTQILLTELEVQQGTVTRALEKRDNARNALTQTQANEKQMSMQIARFDDPSNSSMDAQQHKQMATMIENYRAAIAGMKTQEQEAGNVLQDAESALRKEQDTLAGIQEQLNAVVKKLQPAVQ